MSRAGDTDDAMTETARAVVIGGGAVGVSVLYHLALAGWTDCVLLEKSELTAGSTWHAAGNCPSFSTSFAVMNLQRTSLALYRDLAARAEAPIGYHVTGSLRLAHSPERMAEFARAVGMGRAQGMDLELLGVEQIRDRYPFCETHDLAGALWDSADGDIDPAQLTQGLAGAARGLGATIHRGRPATGIDRDGREWIVRSDQGDIRCQIVVNAAGYYARRVGDWFRPFGGGDTPLAVMSHQYLLTGPIPELAAHTAATGHKLPLLRDVDVSYYLRQEKDGFNLGPYERNCRAHWETPDDPMPEDFSFQLFPDDLERLEAYIADACARVPLLASGGVTRVINGPIPYTPDGLPLLGPMPGVADAFQACAFTFGITQAGGAGKVLAEWITEGAPEWDIWSCDPRRFTGPMDQGHVRAKAVETYGHEYAMNFPHAIWPAGRDRRLSALDSRMRDAGGVMAPYGGWERAAWYARPGEDTGWDTAQTWRRDGPWAAQIAAEAAAVRDSCGVIAIPGFTRLRLTGPGARGWLDSLTVSRLPKPGRIGLAYFADARGRVVTEMSVIGEEGEAIGVITAAAAGSHDADLLRLGAPRGVTVEDWSAAVECLLVTGPTARQVLAPLTDGDLTLPWLSVQDATLVGARVALVRVSFAGELGWEIHCGHDDAPAIWEAVTAAGAVPAGMWALDSLRIEKGYRAWKQDLSTDYTLLESGLERFIDWSKAFPGKAALLAEREAGPKRLFVTLKLEGGDRDAPYMAAIRHRGDLVGDVTSAAWGHRVGAALALGMIQADLAAAGTWVEVEVFGERVPAEVLGTGTAWDPGNCRIRA